MAPAQSKLTDDIDLDDEDLVAAECNLVAAEYDLLVTWEKLFFNLAANIKYNLDMKISLIVHFVDNICLN